MHVSAVVATAGPRWRSPQDNREKQLWTMAHKVEKYGKHDGSRIHNFCSKHSFPSSFKHFCRSLVYSLAHLSSNSMIMSKQLFRTKTMLRLWNDRPLLPDLISSLEWSQQQCPVCVVSNFSVLTSQELHIPILRIGAVLRNETRSILH